MRQTLAEDAVIEELNAYAVLPRHGFWLCGLAKAVSGGIAHRLDELHPAARQVVEHYLKATGQP